ncbi:hypothetical protein PVT68_14210 [Microbulbifer bruguierae]|uniref:Lipoprotein n=1 Tax=Microbulbifer bruguierae TaxID=3029061 RepID=A0ABY8NBW5_9GAMM|nr:hypothetical protein [Microbulbifer bruguierae]WGL15919.1 hypothetical protein PVT68_14210 [Microbulbifer bruguierae]
MKKLFFLFCIFLASCASPEYGYVVFDFYSMDEGARKDYWLGLTGRRGTLHLSSQQPIQKILVGSYGISHLDRSNNLHCTRDDLHFAKAIRFEVIPERITYLGVLTLERTGKRPEYAFRFATGAGLLRRACDRSPDLFDTYSVRLALMTMKSGREFDYDCATGTAE